MSSTGPSDTITDIDQGNNLRSTVGADTQVNGPLGVSAVINSSGTTYFTRDPSGNLIDEHGASGTYDYLTDRTNSVLSLLTTTGTDAGDYTYDPYGALTNAASLTTAAAANPWRFDSGYQDTEGDNDYHFGARYYDPTVYRFTQPDSVAGSIANPNTENLYAYAGGDPLNNTDPNGHDFLDFLGGLAGAVGGADVGGVTGRAGRELIESLRVCGSEQ